MGLEDDFLLADADDEKTIEFIKNYLPQELKEKFSDDELYYFPYFILFGFFYNVSHNLFQIDVDIAVFIGLSVENATFRVILVD